MAHGTNTNAVAADATATTFPLAVTSLANAVIDVDDLLNLAEAAAPVSVTVTPAGGETIQSAKIGDTDLTATDVTGAYTFDATELPDGEYTITVVTRDGDNNDTTTTRTITIDRAAPAAPMVALTTDSGAAGDMITNNAALTVMAEDGATVEYSLTDGEWSATYDQSTLADGQHTVKVRVKDVAGNVSGSSEITFTLDTTGPADADIDVEEDLNAAEAVAAVPVTITPAADATIVSAKIGDTALTATDVAGAYTFDATGLADGEHTIRVVTKDVAGNERITERTVRIDTHAPTGVTLSNDEVSEAAEIGDVVGTLGAVDASPTGVYTFAIVDENGDPVADSLFEVVENDEGVYEVRVKAALDHETAATHTIRVKVSDGVNTHVQNVTVTIEDESEHAPTNIRYTGGIITEKAAVGSEFVTLSAVDADEEDSFTYTLVTDGTGTTPAQNPVFEIVGNKIRVKAALNDAQVGFHELWVKVTDAGGLTYVKAITVMVYNAEEAPENVTLTLANQPLNELAANGTEVGTLTATDQDAGNSVTFRLVDDAGGRFEIANGKIVVKNGLKLDYEQARSHKVTVEAKDVTGLVTQQTFTINLGNVNGETVSGTAASEAFFGGAGLDVLNGGSGNDTLGGGLGNDVLTGGTGRDAFVFNTALNKSTNVDTISSFSTRDDTIRLESAVFKKLTKTGTLNKDFFATGTKAKDKNDYIVYNNKTGALYYDADGSGKGAAVKFAQLPTKLGLTNADFFVI